METVNATISVTEVLRDTLHPSKTNPRKTFNEKEIETLAESIKVHGLQQPIVVRLTSKGISVSEDVYEIVAGERRYRAISKLGWTLIPVIVRELTDEQVIEIQLTENLARTDLDPLEEAESLKLLADTRGWKAQEVAARVGKSPFYVASRMQLCYLIDPVKKLFLDKKLPLTHALELARLHKDDQKEMLEAIRDWGGTGGVRSVEYLRQMIEKLTHHLASAPWKKDDAELVKEAGACKDCTKRTGTNVLFEDMKAKDRCLDGKCFSLKKTAFTLAQLAEVLETQPTIKIVSSYSNNSYGRKPDPNDPILKYLGEQKIKVLNNYDDFYIRDKSVKQAEKAFCIDGEHQGKFIYITKVERTNYSGMSGGGGKKKLDEMKPAEQVKELENRQKRNVELAGEKIHEDMKKHFKEHKLIDTHDRKPVAAEWAMLSMIAYDAMGFERDGIQKVLGFRPDEIKNSNDLMNRMVNLKPEQVGWLIRKAAFNKFGTGFYSTGSKMLAEMMRDLLPKEQIEAIEKPHNERLEKQIARSAERITALKAEGKTATKEAKEGKSTPKKKEAVKSQENAKSGNKKPQPVKKIAKPVKKIEKVKKAAVKAKKDFKKKAAKQPKKK